MTQERTLDIQLSSNGYDLEMTPERLGWLEPTDSGLPIARLREQFQAQGYLWLKGSLPRARVLDMRRRYFTLMQESGLVHAGFDPVEGIYAGSEDRVAANSREDRVAAGREDRVAVNRALMTFVRTAAYESFCLMEELWGFFDRFLDGDSYLHKRKIVRHTRPQDKNCTGAHYDLVYLRGGTDRVVTSWIPMGDTPVEMGGLVYLEGSDAWGRQMEAEYQSKASSLPAGERVSAYNKYMADTGWMTKDLASLANRVQSRWLAADYEAGDMVLHSPYMVHASTVNLDPAGRMRLSTDIRYQRVRDEIDARWQNHWSLDDML